MSEKLKIIVWDVQHGNAIYVNTPGNKDFVIDLGTGSCGNNDWEFSPLLHLKKHWNVPYLDGVIITHPHSDHIDDILNFDKLNPRVIRRPKHLTEEDIKAGNRSDDEKIIDKYLEINDRYCSSVSAGENHFSANNNGGAEFKSFWPKSCATSNLNNHSIITIISCADSKILIPGDNEPPSWNELFERSSFVSAIKGTDILVAPHHGRQSGFSKELFEHISSRLTIISDGPSDTTASDKYSDKSRGWTVHKRNGGKEKRNCVTTRKDGVIEVDFGNNTDGKPYIQVTVD
ncbi:MAG TPA: MBL fold metallo-hydrolase [Desulfobacterales bacterium]|nr:MBL fold metallo-hydrolase [Desulfobacterales bacterium]